MTLEQFKNSSREEQTKYIADFMSKVKFDNKGEVCNVEITRYEEEKYAQNYRPTYQWGDYFYRIIEEPTPEQQFQELIKRKGFEVGKRVKYINGAIHLISDLTDSIITFSNENGEVWAYNCNELYGLERLELLPEPTQEEITAKFVKDNNLKIGDKLKVVRSFESDEWFFWFNEMAKLIGKIGIIEKITNDDIELKLDGCVFNVPPQSLEVVKYRPFQDGAEFEKHKGNRLIRFKKEETLSKFGIVALQTYNMDTIKVSSEKRMSFQDAFERLEFVNSITDETGEPFGVEL